MPSRNRRFNRRTNTQRYPAQCKKGEDGCLILPDGAQSQVDAEMPDIFPKYGIPISSVPKCGGSYKFKCDLGRRGKIVVYVAGTDDRYETFHKQFFRFCTVVGDYELLMMYLFPVESVLSNNCLASKWC